MLRVQCILFQYEEDYTVHQIQFELFDDAPSFLNVDMVRHPSETLDEMIERARKELRSRLSRAIK